MDTVPSHCADTVAAAAQACAQRWWRFADEIARRDPDCVEERTG